MKKVAIIAGIILTTGLTALSITKKVTKPEEARLKIENVTVADKSTVQSANASLGTAD
ncbi:MAG: hypothetical protein JWQ79_3559 [Mucilaginibacter sp.]|jgi:hypothetical protein|nr:hypothetical protein [Mucilaginibacter sp.]